MGGTKYLDYMGALGANLLGYANQTHVNKIMPHLHGGFSHSLPTCHEVEAAEKLKEIFPFCSHFKFLKTGSEACSAALRIARTHTGRLEVLSEGYHGWHDEFTSLAPSATGIPPHLWIRRLWDFSDITQKTAAVIVEPVQTDNSPSRIKWLQQLRETCTATGTMLIFDEIITALRYKDYSVAWHHNILPDLILAGKGLANGMAISCVGGKDPLMNSDYFVSGTFFGEVLPLVATKACIEMIQQKSEYSIDLLWVKGDYFLQEFNKILAVKIRIKGYPTRGVFEGEPTFKAFVFPGGLPGGHSIWSIMGLQLPTYRI